MKRMPLFLAPLFSGILLILSFPPFNLFLPPFVALVPLLYFLDNESSNRRAALGALFCGLLFWGVLLYWITLFTEAGYLLLILVLALNQLLFALVIRRLKRSLGLPLALTAPPVWVALEYLHAHGDLAFTWGQLAYTLTGFPLWLQMASLTGPYGVGLWLAAINALIYELLKRGPGWRPRRNPALVLALLLAFPALFGGYRYRAYEKLKSRADRLKVSYIQPSIPQEIKWSPELRDSITALLGELTLGQAENHPRLVLWPEAAVPANLRFDQAPREYIGSIARRLDCFILTGASEFRYNQETKRYDAYNSAFFFGPEGDLEGSYDKLHLVPISERMPYEQTFTRLRDIDVGGSHFIPGKKYVIFEMGEEKFSVLICFESIFPELSRSFVSQGARFLANITNDAWFERSPAASQHSSFLVLRAIEEGREIVRAANTGVSAFYDRLGRRRQATALFEPATATDTILTFSDRTFYNRYGDLAAHLAWILSLLLLVISFRGSKSKSKAGSDVEGAERL